MGGNLTQSPGPLIVDVTVSGTVKRRQALRRQGARPGDLRFRLRLDWRGGRGPPDAHRWRRELESCRRRYLYPDPRVRMGVLVGEKPGRDACIDLSDGLADGVRRIAAASGVGIRIDAAALPIDPDARRWFEAKGEDTVERAVDSGDDYELLFTTRPQLGGPACVQLSSRRDVRSLRWGFAPRRIDVVLDRAGEPLPYVTGL